MSLSNQTLHLEPHKGKPQTLIGGAPEYSDSCGPRLSCTYFDSSKLSLLLCRSLYAYFNALDKISKTRNTRLRR